MESEQEVPVEEANLEVGEETTEEPVFDEEEDEFEESFDEDAADSDEYDVDEEEDAEELFRENPLKALWIRLGEVKELLEDGN